MLPTSICQALFAVAAFIATSGTTVHAATPYQPFDVTRQPLQQQQQLQPEAGGDTEYTFQCPNAGYFCATVRPQPYGMTTVALQSPTTPLISVSQAYSQKYSTVEGDIEGGPLGPGPGPGRGRRREIAKFFACRSSNARSVPIAECPQNECQQGYCAGGGPASVPRHFRGEGLFCGRTIVDQLRPRPRVAGEAEPAIETKAQAEPQPGGAEPERGPGRGPGHGPGGPDGSYDEYVLDNLYYIAGNQGINLGPCSGGCVSGGRGQDDYCRYPAA
ncbi:hypothetical protein BGZ94_009082 [Podila epigama]|nr:hypothetical protein BGZ94_009082 [Podila epigama]